eukprot:m51a1_g3391 hypothetical protein (202) ;mRNA; r:514687-515292
MSAERDGILKYARPCCEFSGRHTAVLVIDMQQTFCPAVASVAGAVARVVGAADAAGALAVFTQHARSAHGGVLSDWCPDAYPRCGAPEWELVPAMRELSEERAGRRRLVVQKDTQSVFVGTGLEDVLKELGVRAVVVTGVFSESCCAASARDAFCRGFSVAVVRDACAGSDGELHAAALKALAHSCAYVPSADEFCGLLRQ